MEQKRYSRRTVVRLAARVSVVGAVGGLVSACGQSGGTVCVDPDALSFGEASIRNANNYVEASGDTDKTCGNCAFFKAEAGAACGDCEIFEGPANREGYCDSWSALEADA